MATSKLSEEHSPSVGKFKTFVGELKLKKHTLYLCQLGYPRLVDEGEQYGGQPYRHTMHLLH